MSEFICKKCGEKFFYHRRKVYCDKCRKSKYSSNEDRVNAHKKQLSENAVKRRKRIKTMAIEYKGGKCVFCGYDKCYRALEFHHINPNEKEFGIAYKGCTYAWEKVKQELDKCILVCSNCHAEIHEGLINIPKEFQKKSSDF